MTDAHWADQNAKCFGVLLDGRAQETGIRRIGSDVTILLIVNAHHDDVDFSLPPAPGNIEWTVLVDTVEPERSFGHTSRFDTQTRMAGRSLLLLMARPDPKESHREAQRSFEYVMDILSAFSP